MIMSTNARATMKVRMKPKRAKRASLWTLSRRLGEAEEQLVARFGPVAQRSKELVFAQGRMLELCPRLGFGYQGWGITCYIIEGRCGRIGYCKAGEWTEDQFKTVLTSNAQGANWTDVSQPMIKGLIREWKREDGGYAHWDRGSQTMMVTNPVYDRAVKLLQDKAKAESAAMPKI
jgi:hypothetical protein